MRACVCVCARVCVCVYVCVCIIIVFAWTPECSLVASFGLGLRGQSGVSSFVRLVQRRVLSGELLVGMTEIPGGWRGGLYLPLHSRVTPEMGSDESRF